MMLERMKIIMFLLFSMSAFAVYAEQQLTFDEIKTSAEKGDAKAQAQLGSIYFLGSEFKPKANARFKTRKAFEAIAHLLEGTKSDYQTATKWMLKAVDQNYVDAEVFMAAMYDRGMGVKQDTREATRLYTKASKQGNDTSTAIIGQYANSRLIASTDIPESYALKILNEK